MPNKFATAAKGPQEAQHIIQMVYRGNRMMLRKPRNLSSAVGVARLRFRVREQRVGLFVVVNREIVELGNQAAWELVGCTTVYVQGESTQVGGPLPGEATQALRRLLAARQVLHDLQRSFIRSGAPSPVGSGTEGAAITSLAVAGQHANAGAKADAVAKVVKEPSARFTVQLVHLNGTSRFYCVRADYRVARFMQAIEYHERLRAGQYRLVHNGRKLATGTMASNGVREDSRIDVILPCRFVGPAEEAARMAVARSRLVNSSGWKL